MSKPLSTVATLGFLKVLLILFNTMFWASGLVMLIIGAWMLLQLHNTQLHKIDADTAVLSSLSIIFLSLAATILIFAALACCCTAKGKVPLLYLYSFLLMAILLVESTILFCGYWFSDKITKGFHAAMSNGLQYYGKEPSMSSIVDDIQTTLSCCGLTNYTDWQGTPWGQGHPDKLPYSCCQFTTEAVCSAYKETAAVHRTGCYRLVINFILENVSKIGVAIAFVALIHILGVALTCLLARSISKANYEEIRCGCRGQEDKHQLDNKETAALTSSHHPYNSGFEDQKQLLSSKQQQPSNVVVTNSNTTSAAPVVADVTQTLPPPPSNPIFTANPCNTVMTSCAGCVQYQCQQCPPNVSETMEMTAALLHSQPPLQLVSCHGPIMHPATPSNQRIGHQVPVQLSSTVNDMPEYSNLPQPRTQANLASAAANAASSMSFNSKRSRHSSLWSLQDEQDEELSNDMVNYGNDPFGHTNAEYAMMGRGETNEDRHRESIRTTGTSIGIMDNPRSTNAFSQTRHSSASNEALN